MKPEIKHESQPNGDEGGKLEACRNARGIADKSDSNHRDEERSDTANGHEYGVVSE